MQNETACKLTPAKNEWFNDQKVHHRIDGPAIEHHSGTKVWLIEGKIHRTDGPAVEAATGYQAWYVNNKRHRADGPAIVHADGSCEYWLDGVRIDPTRWEKIINLAPTLTETIEN